MVKLYELDFELFSGFDREQIFGMLKNKKILKRAINKASETSLKSAHHL